MHHITLDRTSLRYAMISRTRYYFYIFFLFMPSKALFQDYSSRVIPEWKIEIIVLCIQRSGNFPKFLFTSVCKMNATIEFTVHFLYFDGLKVDMVDRWLISQTRSIRLIIFTTIHPRHDYHLRGQILSKIDGYNVIARVRNFPYIGCVFLEVLAFKPLISTIISMLLSTLEFLIKVWNLSFILYNQKI